MNHARVVRAARRARRVSQRELAGFAGLPVSTVQRIEAGQVTPHTATLERLLHTLGFALYIGDQHGTLLELDDEHDRLRDRGGRRFPAHLKALPTPDYCDVDYRDWWGWDRISWPFGVGKPVPEHTFWRRRRPSRYRWLDAT